MANDQHFIPPVRLNNEHIWEAVRDRIEELVLAGRFILGKELADFEAAAAKTFGASWCVGTSSGTSALTLALRAADLPPGARVAIPANTFFATLEAVVVAGHQPVVVDVCEDYCIDVDGLSGLSDIDAVIPVHLYGLPADMPRLSALAQERGWWVLEDASQAHGATVNGDPVGSLGDAAAFSAYPTKNLGAWGDAGFVTGSDPALEKKIRSLRHHAQEEPNVHSAIGGTERMDNLQALVLLEKLKHVHTEAEQRRSVAAWYRTALADLDLVLPEEPYGRTHVYHQFVVRTPRRDILKQHLEKTGIGASIHYPVPVHKQPGATDLCELPSRPSNAESWASQILSLPIYPGLTEVEVERVAAALKQALRVG